MSHELPTVAGFDASRHMEGFVYDEAKADKAARFFPKILSHVQGSHSVRANEPFELLPWQESIVRLLFGIVHEETGLRRFREAYIEIPRKNGKTTFAAGLALYGLFCDREAAAQCYCAAGSRDQAGLLFDVAAGMVNKSVVLKTESKILKSKKRILFRDSYLRAVASDAHKLHGLHSHIVVADEVHAWAKGGFELYDVLSTGSAARPQPVFISITTAGYDRESKCYKLHTYAKGVRDGRIKDPSFLPVVFGADPDDDWTDPDVWRKANPCLDITLPVTYLEQRCEQAKASPSFQNAFRMLHLNQWVSQRNRWIDMDAWLKCEPEQ